MKLPAHPRTKPSGVEWLGDVPEHWETCLLKRGFRTVDYGISDSLESEGEVAILRMGNISNGKIVTDDLKYIDTVEPSLFLQPGDLLYNRTNSLDLIGKVGMFIGGDDSKVSFASYLVRLRTNDECLPGYFAYLLNTDGILGLARVNAFVSIGQCNLNPTRYGQIAISIPPLPEQRAIAAFLDRETGRLDRLVAKKRELIERLKEKRTALISRTVTRGLPPAAARAAGLPENPPLKPSGLDWLGDIPKHWEVKQLKWAVMFQRGHDLPTDEREEGEIPLVTSAGISATHSRAAAIGPGIVTGRYGTIGEFYLVDRDYWPLNTTLYTINLRGNNPRFLIYLLRHLSPLFLLNAVKSAVPGVDRNDIHSVITAVPPLPEQAAIAAYLDLETAKLDALVGKVEEAVERLQEYRTALITAAVTGKIDVRLNSQSNTIPS